MRKLIVPKTDLFAVRVYMTAEQRQRLREEAARRGISMSEYVKRALDRAHRGLAEGD